MDGRHRPDRELSIRVFPAWRRFRAARSRFEWHDAVVDGRHLRARRSVAVPAEQSPPVVLLAGFGLSGRYLLPVGAALAEGRPVWIPELPGYGTSDPPPRTLDIAELAEAVAAWMTAVGLETAVLVGNSVGCQVAVELAARHPERVTHLVLQGPTIDAHAHTVPRQLWRLAKVAFIEPPSLVVLQVADWLGTGPRRLVPTTRHAFAHRIEERLSEVWCPALVVRGSRDPIVSQLWAEEVAAGLPDGELVVVPGGSHAMTYSDPTVLAELIEGHVAAR